VQRGATVTAREILDKASKDIGIGLRNDPELRAKMMYTMADTYFGLGFYSRAQSLLEGAVKIQPRVLWAQAPRNTGSRGA
jgi:eukaryotic-like serine/threonine-protein kinase